MLQSKCQTPPFINTMRLSEPTGSLRFHSFQTLFFVVSFVFLNTRLGVGDSGFTERRFPGARLSDQRWRLRADVPLGQRGAALQDRQSPGQIEWDQGAQHSNMIFCPVKFLLTLFNQSIIFPIFVSWRQQSLICSCHFILSIIII